VLGESADQCAVISIENPVDGLTMAAEKVESGFALVVGV
jgi:hypothetical protein